MSEPGPVPAEGHGGTGAAAPEPAPVWLVHAGPRDLYARAFEVRGVVAIAAGAVPSVDGLTYDEIREAVYGALTDSGAARRAELALALHRLAAVMQVGDLVITPVGQTRELLLGEVTAGYSYGSESSAPVDGYDHVRPVRWLRSEAGHLLPARVRHQLTSPVVIHQPGAQRTLVQLLTQGRAAAARELTQDPGAGHRDPLAETQLRATELLKDLLARLRTEPLGAVVVGVLSALGLHAFVTDPSRDAVDELVASERPLRGDASLQVLLRAEPGTRFPVEDLEGFAATLTQNERGLVVATGGFAAPCRDEAADRGIELIDVDHLAELVERYYDRLDERTRQLVPLSPVLFPVV